MFFENSGDIYHDNFNGVFDKFLQQLVKSIDMHAPLIKLSRKQVRLKRKPWITSGILKSIKTKQTMYKTHFVHGNASQKKQYKKYANKLTKIKFTAKQLYYQSELNSSNNNSQIWRVIKSLLSSQSAFSSYPHALNLGNILSTNPALISEKFNNHFSEIGKSLAKKINSSNSKVHLSYLNDRVSSSLFLYPTTPIEIYNLLLGLKNSKSCGYDNISTYFLKIASKVLASPLSYLFNLSFQFGIFPDSLKIAKIIPIYKSGEKNDVSNYRPISILSPISKILEKLIHSRSTKFFEKNSVISSSQYGFRSNHSTHHALLDVLTSSYDNINHKKHTALLFLDLKKAFDTVNHTILLDKLEHYGIRGLTLKLFSSFLFNRYQFVSVANYHSTLKKLTCGVPQGSVLGPLLFTLYINDIGNSVSCIPRLFADDTCLIVEDNDIKSLNIKVTSDISTLNKWMVANKLTLNLAKSKLILIPPKQLQGKLLPINSLNFASDLQIVNSSKYLGITFDENLSFKIHIDNLSKKLSRAVGILAKVKPFLNTPALRQLYFALFHSHLQYGLLTWSSTFKSYLKKISVLQNKAVKIVGGGKWMEKATPFYSHLKILKLVDLIDFETAKFMHKYLSQKLPTNFDNYFKILSKYQTKSTRGTSYNNVFLPYFKTKKLQRSIKFQGPKLWNSLNNNIKNLKSLRVFKSKLKTFFLETYCS